MLKSNRTMTVSSRLKMSASAVALLAVVGATGAAYAQDSDNLETVVVTGYRASLEKAMDIKRTALDASDSILAEDIGKFPDMNVSESLQRIPGVAITRESGEGRQVTVRGLGAQFTRVRINGMESLTTVGGQDTNTSGGGTNRGRGFDFNVFASELFSALTVHKSNSASLEEGSLGATVDLKTGHPFDFNGFVFTTSAQYGYQQYGGGTSPRVAALISDTFLGGRIGVLFSGAYAIQNTVEEGSDNGRWVTDYNNTTAHVASFQFASVNGATTGTDFSTANAAFRPRFPRYGVIPLHEKRLGLTGSIQWQPDDATLVTVDGMYADFAQVREEMYMEPYALSTSATSGSTPTAYPRVSSGSGATALCIFTGETCATPTQTTVQLATSASRLINYTAANIDSNDNLLKADMTNVGLRSEHRLDHLDTRFMQLTVDATHDFSDKIKVHAMMGWSESHHRNPIQTTITADLGCVNTGATSTCANGGAGTTAIPFQYDYSNGDMPMVNMGLADATNASGWYLSQIRERANGNFNAYRTAVADFLLEPIKEIKISGGINYRNYGYNTYDYRRSNGSNTNLDAVIPGPVQSAFIADPNAYAQVIGLKNLTVPAGSTTKWWVPDINKMNTAFGLWDQSASHYAFTDAYAQSSCDADGAQWSTTTPYTLLNESNAASLCGAFHMGLEPNITSVGTVGESDYGGWLQVDWDSEFYGVPFRGNIGGRYILTEQSANGYVLSSSTVKPCAATSCPSTTIYSVVPVTASQTYHDFLPALNMVLEPTETFLIRFNASYAMSRPALNNLLPSATAAVSGSNWNYTVGNPKLPPARSKNIDLAFEWYYHKGALLSIAGFYKHLDNLTKAFNTPITWVGGAGPTSPATYGLTDPSPFAAACGLTVEQWNAGQTTTICGDGYKTSWNFSTNVNDKGAPLYGMELNWQQPLDFLPAPLDNFGVTGNLTLVQAQQTYLTTYYTWNNATTPIANVSPVTQSSYKGDLIGLSRTSYNGTIYYDDQVFQARVTANFRSHYMINSGSNTLNLGTFTGSSLNIDASASYKLDENLMFTLDALNLTNQGTSFLVDSFTMRTNYIHKTGSVFFAGVKYTY